MIGPDGYIDLRYNGALGDLMGQAYGQWFEVEVPLAGDFAWERTDHGTVSLSEINHTRDLRRRLGGATSHYGSMG